MGEHYAFDLDTRLRADGDGRFTAELTDRWNHLWGVDGGYVMALPVRALAEVLPFPDPLTVTAHFIGRPVPGPVTVSTEIVRIGGRHATGAASVIQGGKEIVRLLGTFGDLARAEGPMHVTAEPPALPPPEEAIDPVAHFPPEAVPPIARQLDGRVAELPGWLRGAPTGRPVAEVWIRFADGRPADAAALTLLADGSPPVALEIGQWGSVTLELTLHVRARPAPGWVAVRKETRFVIGGYLEEDVELWDSSGALAGQSRQLAILPRAREAPPS